MRLYLLWITGGCLSMALSAHLLAGHSGVLVLRLTTSQPALGVQENTSLIPADSKLLRLTKSQPALGVQENTSLIPTDSKLLRLTKSQPALGVQENTSLIPADSRPSEKKKHCIFTFSSLYGANLSDSRVEKSLSWYQHATAVSIQRSREYLSKNFDSSVDVHVETVLLAENKYLTANLSASVPIVRYRNGMKANPNGTIPFMQSTVRNNKCTVISLMRLDADDVMLPTCLSNIVHTYQKNCSSSTKCIMVSGTHHIRPIDMHRRVADRSSRNAEGTGGDDTVYCGLRDPVAMLHAFWSPGLTVTMSTDLWNTPLFGGNRKAMLGWHSKIYANLKKTTENSNGTIELIKHITKDDALWVRTPLSGHYDFDGLVGETTGCNWTKLESLLGKASADMVREAATAHIPKLTRAEWAENVFVAKGNNKTLK